MRSVYFLSSCFGFATAQDVSGLARHCKQRAEATSTLPGGVSDAADFCVRTFWEQVQAVGDGYALEDLILDPPLERVRVSPFGTWNATTKTPPGYGDDEFTTYLFGQAEWVLPRAADRRRSGDRVVYIHGGSAADSALGDLYNGFVDHMAQVTGLPVFAFDFDQEPVVPWPENIRSIFNFLEYALEHGPDGRERAERIFIVADSEGTLTALQVTASLLDNGFKEQMGYAQSTPLENPSQWLAGLVLSSPVVDVDCQTESFAYNIWNATTMSGDPDTGVGWDGYSLEDIIGDCRWSYIEYAYGLRGDWGVANDTDANEQFARNKGFYTKPLFDPINGGLKGFPPVYMVSGVRDFYYSDAPNLAYQLCMDGIEFEIYNAEGLFHDWWLYSNGCGVNGSIGPRGKIPESLVVDNQVAKFVRKHGSRPTPVVV